MDFSLEHLSRQIPEISNEALYFTLCHISANTAAHLFYFILFNHKPLQTMTIRVIFNMQSKFDFVNF